MEYILHVLILIGIYIMLSESLSLPSGFGGMISLAHAGFYGLGAYSAAILSLEGNLTFLEILPISMTLCGITAIVVASIALKTVDDYFIICSLGIQIIIYSILNNWLSLTNGPMGISGIPEASVFGVSINSPLSFFAITLAFTIIIHLFIRCLVRTAFGRTLRSLSEDEIFTASLGKKIYLSKITAFTISGMLAAIPGVLYAFYFSYINPSSFSTDESIFILSIVIFGGMQKLKGCIAASTLLVLLPELLRFVGLPNAAASNLRQVIYGAVLVILMFRNSEKGLKS